jgi:hypothetical protein
MSGEREYRDALAAAHERIAQLERPHVGVQAALLAALYRERAGVVQATKPRKVWSTLRLAFVVFWGAAIALAFDRHWLEAAVASISPVIAGLVGQRISTANAHGAGRQLALVEARIAELEVLMKNGPTATLASPEAARQLEIGVGERSDNVAAEHAPPK